jgi:hypothetical protein
MKKSFITMVQEDIRVVEAIKDRLIQPAGVKDIKLIYP